MDGKLKQRVIGVVVLTALAIIILPLLLDGNEAERERIVQRIPARPTLEVVDVDPKTIISEMDQIEAASKAQLPKEVEPSGEPQTSQSSLDANGLPRAWSLQVGSFAESKNAVQLRDALRKKGYRTYAVSVAAESGKHVRVLVGPLLQYQRAVQIKQEIRSAFNLPGQIVPYNIEDDSGQLGG